MRHLRVTYRPDAIADLADIYRFIATRGQSRDVALAFVRRIRARCHKIGDAPNGGRPRDDLRPGLRTVPFERSAVIAYRVGRTVEIVNVFYGGRDYETLYRSQDEGSGE
ncbi:MAG: type II toxin-antitoxin system RelE/ParE family toxin [Alphaproteobacteria bacterium]|nr:type II toxin-antitoxin system RelE/ParE family toxin [Alphaproteobacteria bacterium]